MCSGMPCFLGCPDLTYIVLLCVGLAEDFLQEYIQVNIGSLDLCANHNILQLIEMCEEYEKDGK